MRTPRTIAQTLLNPITRALEEYKGRPMPDKAKQDMEDAFTRMLADWKDEIEVAERLEP